MLSEYDEALKMRHMKSNPCETILLDPYAAPGAELGAELDEGEETTMPTMPFQGVFGQGMLLGQVRYLGSSLAVGWVCTHVFVLLLLLLGQRRQATHVALTKCEILYLERDDTLELFKADPFTAGIICEALLSDHASSARLRELSLKLRTYILKGEERHAFIMQSIWRKHCAHQALKNDELVEMVEMATRVASDKGGGTTRERRRKSTTFDFKRSAAGGSPRPAGRSPRGPGCSSKPSLAPYASPPYASPPNGSPPNGARPLVAHLPQEPSQLWGLCKDMAEVKGRMSAIEGSLHMAEVKGRMAAIEDKLDLLIQGRARQSTSLPPPALAAIEDKLDLLIQSRARQSTALPQPAKLPPSPPSSDMHSHQGVSSPPLHLPLPRPVEHRPPSRDMHSHQGASVPQPVRQRPPSRFMASQQDSPKRVYSHVPTLRRTEPPLTEF